jgi:ATP-binding cassette subfamily C protein LapB
VNQHANINALDEQPVSAPRRPQDDPLSTALLYLAGHYGRALSREALLAGLPLQNNRLDINLFGRAALRAGLESAPVKRTLLDIPPMVLPAVLLLKNDAAVVAVKLEHAANRVTIVSPASKTGFLTIPLSTLEADYLGYAFLVRPASLQSTRDDSTDIPQPHWFWTTVRKFWANYSHVAIAAFIVNMLALASPLFVMNVYDRVIPNGAVPSLVALAIGLLLAIAFDFALRLVRSHIVDMTGKKIDVVLAADIFEHVMSIKMSNRPTSVGVLANQLRDFDSVRDFFTSGTVVSATDLVFAFLFIGLLFVVAGPLAWIPVLMLPVMILAGALLQKPLQNAMKRLQVESSARHGVLIEAMSGVEAVRAVGGEARMQMAWERSVAATARSGEDVHFWSSLAMTISSSAQQLTSLLIVITGVFLILDGKLSVGALVASNMLAGRVLAPIGGIASLITRATQTLIALRSIDRLMGLERERPTGRTYIARKIEDGRIDFTDVSFKYPTASTNALEKISFSITAGERVAIIGRVGSGKTTVGRLLAHFYEPDEGRILIDGVDIRQYDPADLRSGIGLVLQDTDLFYGTLRDNISIGKRDATDDEILAVAKLSGVERFAATHPLGYEMPIAEGGRSLSGGQRQAIGLARTLIRNPRILFLDEPTAHFDTRSETEFLDHLKSLHSEARTIIIATHRPSLLKMVDRLIVFDQGKIILDGPRDHVLDTMRKGPHRSPESGAYPNVSF